MPRLFSLAALSAALLAVISTASPVAVPPPEMMSTFWGPNFKATATNSPSVPTPTAISDFLLPADLPVSIQPATSVLSAVSPAPTQGPQRDRDIYAGFYGGYGWRERTWTDADGVAGHCWYFVQYPLGFPGASHWLSAPEPLCPDAY